MEAKSDDKKSGSADFQGEIWGKRAMDWAHIQEPKEAPLFVSIISNIKLTGSKTKLLDVGCGSGLLCKLAYDKGIEVTGFDASHRLLDEARKKFPDDVFMHGDMEHLPFDEDSFDVVTAVTSIQFAANPSNALKEAHRVLKKDGQFFMAIWGPPEKCEAGIIVSSLKDLMLPPPKPPPPPGALYEEGKLEKLLSDNSFKPVKRIDVPYSWEYKNTDDLLKAFLAAGPAELAIRHSGEDKVREALLNAMQPLKKEDGSYSIANVFIYVIATK